MKKSVFAVPLLALALMLVAALAPTPAQAAAVLTWSAPTTLANGLPFTIASTDVYTIYKDGAQLATVGGSLLTYTDAAAVDCLGHAYQMTLTATSTTLTSAKSPAALLGVDTVACAPLAPSSVKATPK
jgi:hypothetical protein